VRRVAIVIVAVVVAVVIGAAGLAVAGVGWVTARAYPPTTGTVSMSGLSAPVTVSRDVNGLVRIEARTPADLFRAQGWVHASERFWQMEVWRHISAGRLSELFGSATLDDDRFIRTLGWRQAAQRDLDAASPETRAALDAYAAGVNDYVAAHPGSLGPAFATAGALAGTGAGLDGHAPEQWTPLDSVAWGKVQAWGLGGDYDAELWRILAVKQGLDPALFPTLFPPYPADAPVIMPTAVGAAGDARTAARTSAVSAGATADQAAALRRLAGLGGRVMALAGISGASQLAGRSGLGSNDWVVSGSRTASGAPILADDPHLTQMAPSIWFVNHLACATVDDACPYDVTGVSFPGVPGVIVGHNARIAWGVTNVNPDVQDIFLATLDPADPGRYLTPTGSEPFTVRTETIEVAGDQPYTVTVRETADGPVLNDVVDGLGDLPELLTLRWTATDRASGTLDSFLALDRAASWDDFLAALSTYGAPSQNFVYADVDGHIGWKIPGTIPIRADGTPAWLPASTAAGDGAWTGTVPFDELPSLYDPPAGMIVTANNAPVDDGYPYYLGRAWDPGFRAARILELLAEAASEGGVTPDDVAAIQDDGFDTRARTVIPYLEAARPTTDDGMRVLQAIAGFDGQCTPSSVGCTAYETFEYALLRYLFDDELGDALARDYVGTDPSRVALRNLLALPQDPLWDRAETAGVTEGRDAMITAAVDQAGRLLRDALGRPSDWTWGRLHRITWAEQTLGTSGVGPLGFLFNVGPYPAPGAGDAVNNTGTDLGAGYADPADPESTPGSLRDVFATTYAPSMRMIVPMSDLDGARIVHAPGQSGHPFSRHYADLADDWLAGRSVPLRYSAAAWGPAATEVLTLTP
jgi:penicillin amidase